MKLDEAIRHSQDVAECTSGSCSNEHEQLAQWLSELKEYQSTNLTPEGVQRLLEASKSDGFGVSDELEQAYRQGYEAGAKQFEEAKDLLAKAYELIRVKSNCATPCIYCVYDSTPDCPKEALFKWKYAERVEKFLGGPEP